ncbi:MAG: EVE domain-containing protein [Cyclobacteriaceae bacterium]|nr:EVE domain-containing protein [Cyclobacteriaceae bacterium]
MNYWLIKSEPGTYSWNDLKKDGQTFWDGVRNYQARNNLKAMKMGDLALFYHSVNEKCVVGIAEVITEAYQDPSTEDNAWVAVDVKPFKDVKQTVSLAEIKTNPELQNMVLVKNSRLSVQPVEKEEFEIILSMAGVK